MCAVSMIYDHYSNRQNWQQPPPWQTSLPPALPWTSDAFGDLKEILNRLAALDKKLGLAHCEDPKKAEWMQEIEKRLKRPEKAAPCAGRASLR